MRVDRYELSKSRMQTIRQYTKEFPEWKKEYAMLTNDPRSMPADETVIKEARADAVMDTAIRRAAISKKIVLVEQTAKEAAPFFWHYLLIGVTEGLTYDALVAKGLRYSRNTYYDRRRRFYYFLSRKLQKMGF